jgi:hypothetical protein
VKRTDGNATYLYCLVHAPRAPRLGRAPRGLPHSGRLRLLDAGQGFWLVAADAPLARYGSAPIEQGLGDLRWVSACAMAHDGVVEHVARRGTVVPMKLFTLFASDARALEHIRRARRRLERLVARVADRQEWGVRLTLDDAQARRRLAAGPRRESANGVSGTGFLLRKKQAHDAARRIVTEARAEAERIFAELSRRADAARRQTPPADGGERRVLLDAAFLVPVRRAAAFRSAVKALARPLDGRSVQLTLTGPWPPYTFVAEPA